MQSTVSRSRPPASWHSLHFYTASSDLEAEVIRYLGNGLREGAAAIIIATAGHRAAFEEGLTREGVHASRMQGSFTALDAQETLDGFTVDGLVDRQRFEATVGSLVRAATAAGGLVAYGEMVALLWEQGNIAAAIALEGLWNELLAREEFTLLCAYPAWLIGDSVEAFHDVCALHTDVDGLDPRFAQPPVHVRAFPVGNEAPRHARQFTAEVLDSLGLSALLQPALIVVSELVTNAVVHARTDMELTVAARNGGLRILVRDGSTSLPETRLAADAQDSGRGLVLVEALTTRWGVERANGTGKVVWADLEG